MGIYGVDIGDGCSDVYKGHKDMHSLARGVPGWWLVSRMDGWQMFDKALSSFCFLAGLLTAVSRWRSGS